MMMMMMKKMSLWLLLLGLAVMYTAAAGPGTVHTVLFNAPFNACLKLFRGPVP